MDFFTSIFGMSPELAAAIVTAIVALCALVATCLSAPDASSGWAYKLFYKVVNAIAFNSGKAANADDVDAARKKL